jgi:hypothetical protein
MAKVPFSKQIVDPVHNEGPLALARDLLERTGSLPNADVAKLLRERQGKRLPSSLQNYLVRFFEGRVTKKRGPKPKPTADAKEDFLIADAVKLYEKWEKFYRDLDRQSRRSTKRRDIRAKGEPTPAERAHEKVLELMKKDFPNITPATLRNRISKRRKVKDAERYEVTNDPNRHPTD